MVRGEGGKRWNVSNNMLIALVTGQIGGAIKRGPVVILSVRDNI